MSRRELVTITQRQALAEMECRGHVVAGWGGITRRTLRSLERRGLARTPLADPDRFTITERGAAVIADPERAA